MGSSKSNRQLAQVLRFEPALGTDERNLAEFPLAAIAHRLKPDQRTLTFEDEITDQGSGQKVARRLVISASEHAGLPTPLDSDVLMVLLYLSNLRNGLTQRTITFSRYELVKLLGWGVGGKSYRRLDEALQRWASVTLYYNQAWWDFSHKKWRSRTFHVIEALDLRGRDDADDDRLSSFTWNEVLFTSLQAKNIKRLDIELYFRLQSAAARQMYRYLDKRFYLVSCLEYELRRFACEHIGFAKSYDTAQLKRRILPAIEELEAVGFLQPMTPADRFRKRGRGDWTITLVRASDSARANEPQADRLPFVDKLVVRGVTTAIASELAERFPGEQIEEKLALHDWLVGKKDRRAAKNPAGFLVKAIRHDYPLPKDFPGRGSSSRFPIRTTPVKEHIDTKAVADKPTIAPADLKPDPFNQVWLRMSPAEQSAFESQALAAGDPFKVATYERLKRSGGPLFEQVRQAILRDHNVRGGRKNTSDASSAEEPTVAVANSQQSG